jgi:uncharacterized membrane protein
MFWAVLGREEQASGSAVGHVEVGRAVARRVLLRGHGSAFRAMARRPHMLWTVFLILLILWLLGVVSSYTLGGFVHILLVLALVVVVIQVIQGRRVV